MLEPLRILIVEDAPADAELAERELSRDGLSFVSRRVENQNAFLAALADFRPDLILSDYTLPAFDGMAALRLAVEHAPSTPFIIMTGSLNEETAVTCMRSGAWDYVLKDRIVRLPMAVRGALDLARTRRERANAERASRQSEERYRELVDNMSSGVAVYEAIDGGRDFVFKEFNRAAERIEGTSREAVLGRRVTQTFPGVAELGLLDVLRRVWETGQPEHLAPAEYSDPRKSGWRENHVYKLPSGEVVTVYDDVTDRMRAEKRLLESERKYRELFENSVAAISEALPDGHLVHANAAYAKMYGYDTPDEIIAATTDVGKQLYAEPAERAEMVDTLLRQGTVEPREVRIRRRDGSTRTVLVGARVLRDENGHVRRLQATHIDVTERKRAEQELEASRAELRAIYDSAPVMMCVLDAERRVLYGNAAYTSLTGTTEEALRNGKACGVFGCVNAKDDPRGCGFSSRCHECSLRIAIEDTLATGQEHRDVERRLTIERDGADTELVVLGSTARIQPGPDPRVLFCLQDTTARTRAEEALRRSEERYRLIAENTADVIWTVDLATRRFTYVSPSIRRLRGYTAEEALSQTIDRALTPDSRLRVEKLVSDAAIAIAAGDESARTAVIEVEEITKDGEVVPTEIAATALLDESGRLTGILGVTRDIRERRHAEAALRESEERYRSLFEQSPIGIYRTTPDGRILLANPALLEMLGYTSLDELMTRNLEDPGLQPDYSRHLFKELVDREGAIKGFEAVWTTKGGQKLVVRENAHAIRGPDGDVLYYEGAVEDITARMEAEEMNRRLVTAVEQSAEMVVVTDPNGRIQYANPAFERITGYALQEVAGQTPRILSSGRRRRDFYEKLWRTILDGDVWHGRLTNRRKDGSLYEEEMTISPVRDARGAIVNFVAVKRDVTQEVALQAQLTQAQKMEAIGLLAGGIAHDFNNLLQAMMSQVGVLHHRIAGASDAQRSLTALDELVTRGATLTRQLLLFSRQETVRPERLDLNEVLRSTATMLRRLVRENVEISLELTDGSLSVEADRGQLDQVIINLAVNGSDAMPEGGRLVLRSGRAGEGVWFEVQDSGEGIPEAVRDRIFEPFFTTKPTGRGTGLGLSVVQGIVAQHNGRVELTSQEGEGTRFRVFLPRSISGEFPAVDPSAEPLPNLPPGSGERILIVEDEEGARDGLREILTSLGYRVSAVGSGEEAGTLPAEPEFDLLLTDLLLPGIAGTHLAAGLTARWPDLKVILMSGYAEDEAVRLGANTGRVRFLQKPFDTKTLATAVRRALDEEASA